jgi:hypothetical protein
MNNHPGGHLRGHLRRTPWRTPLEDIPEVPLQGVLRRGNPGCPSGCPPGCHSVVSSEGVIQGVLRGVLRGVLPRGHLPILFIYRNFIHSCF